MIYLNEKKIAVIGIDHGYGNIKTANTITPTAITEYDTEPVFSGNILEYGRSNMDPQPWFNTTVEDYGGDVITAMQKAFREAQEVKA